MNVASKRQQPVLRTYFSGDTLNTPLLTRTPLAFFVQRCLRSLALVDASNVAVDPRLHHRAV